jgi:hypothetical protein
MFSMPTSASDSCTPSGTTYGTDTLSVTIPSTGTYSIWTRMQIPDSADNGILLNIDNTSCYNVGANSSLPTSSWQWVNYYDGNSSNIVSLSLTAGTHSFQYVGTSNGVEIDRVLVLSDATCTPTGTGDNCMQTTTSPPTVSFTNPPSSGALIKGSLALSATATPATGDSISQTQLLVNGAIVQTDTSAPYNFTLNTLGYKDGSYTLSVKAIDNQSLVGTSTDTVTITNGDLNSDNKVNISDLSIMAAHWGSSSATAAQGDLNGDGKVNISDLSVLANNWQQSW